MRVMYNIVLATEHTIGVILLTAVCASRFIFWVTWSAGNEVFFIVCALLVYILNYLLLWLGYKKNLIRWGVVYGLQIVERVLFIPQLVLLALSYVKMFVLGTLAEKIPLSFTIPITIILLVYLITRKISNNHLYCRI